MPLSDSKLPASLPLRLAAHRQATRTVAAVRSALLVLVLLGIAAGCNVDSKAETAPGAKPATRYQTIPPPLVPPPSPAEPQPVHQPDTALPGPADAALLDCRSQDARLAADCPAAVVVTDFRDWTSAPIDFKTANACALVRPLLADPARPILIWADSDRQAAVPWMILRCCGVADARIVWGGSAALRQAGWTVAPTTVEALENRPPTTPASLTIPADPDWMLTDAQFAQLSAGLTPVSGTPPPADPAGADPAAGTETLPPPALPPPALPEQPPVDGWLYCGSRESWDARAADDKLLKGLLRIPPRELYRDWDGHLETRATIQARLNTLGLDPVKRYVLIGGNHADIAAVYLALTAAGYKNLRVYFQ